MFQTREDWLALFMFIAWLLAWVALAWKYLW